MTGIAVRDRLLAWHQALEYVRAETLRFEWRDTAQMVRYVRFTRVVDGRGITHEIADAEDGRRHVIRVDIEIPRVVVVDITHVDSARQQPWVPEKEHIIGPPLARTKSPGRALAYYVYRANYIRASLESFTKAAEVLARYGWRQALPPPNSDEIAERLTALQKQVDTARLLREARAGLTLDSVVR